MSDAKPKFSKSPWLFWLCMFSPLSPIMWGYHEGKARSNRATMIKELRCLYLILFAIWLVVGVIFIDQSNFQYVAYPYLGTAPLGFSMGLHLDISSYED